MTRSSKILATVGIVFVFMIFNAMMQAGAGPGGRNTGVIGIILMFGLIAGIRAVWKQPTEKNAENTKLDKR
jgi:hypothetical protein